MLEFGVGLISFAVRGATGPSEPSAWRKAVEASLLNAANITELTITDDADEFSFVISIPKHLHQDVPLGQLASERYRVRTVAGYYGLFSFVTALDPSEPGEGSLGVRLVREQLAKQLADDPHITLHFVGPSPFHADFTLYTRAEYPDSENIDPSLPISGRVDPMPGYAVASFVYDPKEFATEMTALDALQDDLSDELSLFYAEVQARAERMKAGVSIRQATEELIALHSGKGLVRSFNRFFRAGGKARALALAVMEAEFAIAAAKDHYNEAAGGVYGHAPGYFRKCTDGYAKEDYAFFVENGAKVVKHLEGARTKELEVTAIAGATMLGGVAGALASVIVAAPK